jgi:hypothetical protein
MAASQHDPLASSPALEELDRLEALAVDDPDAQRALLATCAAMSRQASVWTSHEPHVQRASRALSLLDALGVDPASLGASALEDAASIARSLGREALGVGDARRATRWFERAAQWRGPQTSPEIDAWTWIDLAMAQRALGLSATQALREALSSARGAQTFAGRAELLRRSAAMSAEDARRRGALDEAAALDAEADRADDEELRAELDALSSAERFFSARWDGGAPPDLPPESEWLQRSTGAVSSSARTVEASLDCPRVFGTPFDFRCACGAYEGRDHWGVVCDRCGVEVARAARSEARIGHLELRARYIHPAALVEGPLGSMIALALDLSDERVRSVRRRERALRFRVDRPRAAETLAPDAAELRAHDEGRSDRAEHIATGDDALIAVLEALDVEGALEDVSVERAALERHALASQRSGAERLEWLACRSRVLAMMRDRGGGSWLLCERVPVFSERWMRARGRWPALRRSIEALSSRVDRRRDAASLHRAHPSIAEALHELVLSW